MKEARSKRIHTVWLHLREAQKWVKEIHAITSQDNSYYIVITFGEMGDLCVCVCVCVCVCDSATLWTVAHQAPLSMGFSRQEYWRQEYGFHAFFQGSSKPRDETSSLMNPALAGRFFTTSTTWEA